MENAVKKSTTPTKDGDEVSVNYAYTTLLILLAKYSDGTTPYVVPLGSDTIYATTKEAADVIADLLELLGYCGDVHTGYYDPEDDARNNEADECTGLWYVDID